MEQDDPGVSFLERLLRLSERSPDRIRPASAAPDYDVLRTAGMLSRFQAQMLAAERAGAVRTRKGKRERRHLIERVIVQDPAALARHLGRSPANDAAQEAKSLLAPLVTGADAWVHRVLDEIGDRWSRGEAGFRLPPGDTDLAGEFLTLLAAISKDQARGLDARTFALRSTGDTKSFDRHATRIAAVLATRFGESGLSVDAAASRIGLERFGHPIHVKGCILIEDAQGVLINGRAKPFVSIHPEMLPLLKLAGRPALLLTIENFASFNRYVREIDDEALVIYTGGFASAGVIELLKSVLARLDRSISFYHWGDIDPGGLRIFRFLEEALPRSPQPHLMSRSLAEALGKPATPDRTLGTIAKSDSALAELADWLARGNAIRHLEQEALDPISPGNVGAGRIGVSD